MCAMLAVVALVRVFEGHRYAWLVELLFGEHRRRNRSSMVLLVLKRPTLVGGGGSDGYGPEVEEVCAVVFALHCAAVTFEHQP